MPILERRLAEILVEVADTLVADFDLLELLRRLAEHAAAVGEADLVGVLLADSRDRAQFMTATDETGESLELFQLQLEEGPGFDALHRGEPVVGVDLVGASGRWPRFAPAAHDRGYRSVHALPLRLRGRAVGALVLLDRSEERFTDAQVGAVRALADVATIALVQEGALARYGLMVERLEGALNDRIVVEQAKGVVAQQQHLTTGDAVHVLRAEARSSGRRLVDVAASVLARFDV